MLDFPAMGQALWALSDSTGLRPEYVLPVLWSESGFNPAAVNSISCAGINQACPYAFNLPANYTSYTASQQMTAVVSPMFRAIVSKYGAIRSGVRAYQSNFLPASLPSCRSLSSVLASKTGSPTCWSVNTFYSQSIYSANPFDNQHTGVIRVGDLARFVAKAAANPWVKSAIASTYALRPGESPMDPVYGEDFSFTSRWMPPDGVLVAAALLSVGGALYATGALDRPVANLRRALA